ncbi:hypothetical protein OHY99_05580 [Serratia marcescens]|uniref:hypothetical protein n=1 Tax=Serratia marcescens TaxID=615 RepID=UPI00221E41F3|nr:hypothetical protein [Serratia marcescens]UYU05114.1 hypothetical protein OHY99_05580 [Serratia marcescens]
MGESKLPPKPVKIIDKSESFIDVYAESAAITAYESQSGNLVNLCFMRDFITSYSDEDGQPSSAQVTLRKVASLTMTEVRARSLYEALGAALKMKGGEE